MYNLFNISFLSFLFFFYSIFSFSEVNNLQVFPHSKSSLDVKLLLNKKNEIQFDKIDSIKRSSGSNIYNRSLSSVVKILTNEGSGSGVVISSKNKLIITNDHVTTGYNTVGVVFANDGDKDEISLGTVIKFDEIRDLSLVQLNSDRKDLISIPISENSIQIGEDAHAIGHPLGEDWTYTRGYISQIRKNYKWIRHLH